MGLGEFVKSISNMNFGGTDCSLPMTWALQHKLPVDVFVVVHVPIPELKLLLSTVVGKVPAPVRLIVVPVQAEAALLVADTPVDKAKWRDPSTLVWAYTPVEDPAVYDKIFKPFTDYLSQCTAKKVVFFQVQSNAAEIEAMRSGRLHFAGFSTGPTCAASVVIGPTSSPVFCSGSCSVATRSIGPDSSRSLFIGSRRSATACSVGSRLATCCIGSRSSATACSRGPSAPSWPIGPRRVETSAIAF